MGICLKNIDFSDVTQPTYFTKREKRIFQQTKRHNFFTSIIPKFEVAQVMKSLMDVIPLLNKSVANGGGFLHEVKDKDSLKVNLQPCRIF